MKLRLMEDMEADDPIQSVVNLIDVFLVIIAALLLAVANNPVNPFSTDSVTVIKNPGKPNMEVVIKDGQKIERYKASGEIGEGQGNKAGVAKMVIRTIPDESTRRQELQAGTIHGYDLPNPVDWKALEEKANDTIERNPAEVEKLKEGGVEALDMDAFKN